LLTKGIFEWVVVQWRCIVGMNFLFLISCVNTPIVPAPVQAINAISQATEINLHLCGKDATVGSWAEAWEVIKAKAACRVPSSDSLSQKPNLPAINESK